MQHCKRCGKAIATSDSRDVVDGDVYDIYCGYKIRQKKKEKKCNLDCEGFTCVFGVCPIREPMLERTPIQKELEEAIEHSRNSDLDFFRTAYIWKYKIPGAFVGDIARYRQFCVVPDYVQDYLIYIRLRRLV